MARENTGLSIPELAEKSGVAAETISKIERDKIAVPRHATINKLAIALDMSPGQLRRFALTQSARKARSENEANGEAADIIPVHVEPSQPATQAPERLIIEFGGVQAEFSIMDGGKTLKMTVWPTTEGGSSDGSQ